MGLFNFNKNKKEEKSTQTQNKPEKISLGEKLRRMFGGRTLSDEDLDTLEETLISADIGPAISFDLIEKLRHKNVKTIEDGIQMLKDQMESIFVDKYAPIERGKLNIVLVLGVNGVGKTTSIAKMANYYLRRRFKVMLAAGDTFRAAATEQLTRWANRLDVPIIKQGEGADPASVVFDAVDSAVAKGVDLLLIDTAGRLHTKANLMEELRKIERIIESKRTKGIDFIKMNMLVIDGTTGQNAYQQTEAFNELIGVDGIVITKYDAQSKGGIVFTIEKKLGIPFYFIGTGEQLEDLSQFKRDEFIENIFN